MFGHRREQPSEVFDTCQSALLRVSIREMLLSGTGRRNPKPFRYVLGAHFFTPQAEPFIEVISSLSGMKNENGLYEDDEASLPDSDFLREETELCLEETRSGYGLRLRSYGLSVNGRNFHSAELTLPYGVRAGMVHKVKLAHVHDTLSFNEPPTEHQLTLFSNLVRTAQTSAGSCGRE